MFKRLKKNSCYDYIKWTMWIIFLIQIIILGFFNLTQMQNHMGYDASSYLLKAIEIAKQKTLFIDYWVDQTTLYFDSAVPLAAFFYAITGNIFFSYGLANFLVDIAIFYVFYSIIGSLKFSSLSKALCLNLISCLYLMPGTFNNINDVGYFASLLGSGSWYGVKTLIILMVIKMIMDLKDDSKKVNYLYIILTEFLLFISGLSSGWYLTVTIILPMFIFYIIKVLVNNDIKKAFNNQTLVLALGVIISFIGKMIAVKVLDFTSKDGEMILVSLNTFWKNLGSILIGFFELLGAVPYESKLSALGIDGISCMVSFLIFLALVVGIVYVIKRILNDFDKFQNYCLLLCVIGTNLLMFTVLYTTYGSERFEIRYLIPLFLLIVIMLGGFVDSLDDGLIIKMMGMVVLSVCILWINIYDNKLYYSTKNNYDTLFKISQRAEEQDVEVVYIYGSNLAFDARNLRAIDSNRVYKFLNIEDSLSIYHWGDYTYFDDLADAPQHNMLITTDEYFEKMPEYLKKIYTFVEQIDGHSIYVADENKFDLKTGVDKDYGLDLPTSRGMIFTNGFIDVDGSFVSDGTETQCLKGPGIKLEPGVYDFIVNYEVLESGKKSGDFVITFNSDEVAAQIEMDSSQTRAIISDVTFIHECNNLNYCIFNYSGAVIRVKSFEIYRKVEEQ